MTGESLCSQCRFIEFALIIVRTHFKRCYGEVASTFGEIYPQ